MTVFVLGPAEWRSGAALDMPRWIEERLPASWPKRHAEIQPLDVRVALAQTCRAAGKPAVVMEQVARRHGEAHTALFRRIEREHDVRQHFVVWLPSCKRTGLDVELGNLLARFESGERLDVRVFSHGSAAGIVDGDFISLEKGARSRYYSDLYEYGAMVVPWDTWHRLFEAVLMHAGSER